MSELPTPFSPGYRELKPGQHGELSRCSNAADSLRAIASAAVAMRSWNNDPARRETIHRWLEYIEVEARRAALHICPIARANEELK